MASIFTKIVNGEIPCYKIAETEDHLAFLDVNPMMRGHTLCIPKQEVNKYFDLSETAYAALNAFAYRVSKAIEQTIDCDRVAMGVLGLEVPHAHVHLVPVTIPADFRFGKKLDFSPEEMQATAKAISAAYKA